MNTSQKVVVVDYGVGNLWSTLKAVQLFAPEAIISEEREKIEEADALILPGVGTFKAGMEGLVIRGLVDPLREASRRGVPILGICLGAQLLLERGYEFGEHAGLGIIKGTVDPFSAVPKGVKIPAIGWQEVSPSVEHKSACLFDGLSHPYFYFVHSYILKPTSPDTVLATTMYGGHIYCAVVGQGNTVGTQFHPEKSGKEGLRLIENFITSI